MQNSSSRPMLRVLDAYKKNPLALMLEESEENPSSSLLDDILGATNLQHEDLAATIAGTSVKGDYFYNLSVDRREAVKLLWDGLAPEAQTETGLQTCFMCGDLINSSNMCFRPGKSGKRRGNVNAGLEADLNQILGFLNKRDSF